VHRATTQTSMGRSVLLQDCSWKEHGESGSKGIHIGQVCLSSLGCLYTGGYWQLYPEMDFTRSVMSPSTPSAQIDMVLKFSRLFVVGQ